MYKEASLVQNNTNHLNVKTANFDEGIKLKSSSFDIAYAGEVIEHLYNPDLFLMESNRILRKEGYLIISTPNLLAWYNRFLVLMGIQPLFIEPSTKSKMVGAGPLKFLKKYSRPVGHIRIFTLDALKDMFKMYGSQTVSIRGAVYEEGMPKKMLIFDRIISKYVPLCSQFVILTKKTAVKNRI